MTVSSAGAPSTSRIARFNSGKYRAITSAFAPSDGAHNANATAREAWKVMPELMVQHAINAAFSASVGIDKKNVCLSTVPPTATPAPCVFMDLPYAVALRDLFTEYRMRAQMNTKYIESSTRDATVTHVLNMLISKLTSADIQSTITPDEGRNVPWHIYNIEACDTAKQTLLGLDGLMDMVELRKDGAGGTVLRGDSGGRRLLQRRGAGLLCGLRLLS